MPPFGDQPIRFIPEETRRGAVHMALEEVAAETAAAEGRPLVRVFQWTPSTLSMGYGQDPDTVAWSACDDAGIAITRRQTGGGGIYHDEVGDISYSIIVPRSILDGDLMETYEVLCEPVLEFLREVGIDASFATSPAEAIYQPACYLREINPAHDIVVNGAKISGNAQYRQKDAIIQHGSISYSTDAITHLNVFDGHDVTVSRFHERVTSIDEHVDITREAAVNTFERVLKRWAGAVIDGWRPGELRQAQQLATSKYAAPDWVRRPTPQGTPK